MGLPPLTYRALAERADRAIASPWFLAVFAGIVAFAWVSVDVSNFTISVITGGAVILNAGAARRHAAAIQAKLDELIGGLPDARDEMKHVEDRDEREIQELRG